MTFTLKIFILLGLPHFVIGQVNVDSVLQLAGQSTDTTRVLHLLTAGELMAYNDPDRADSTSLAALDLSRDLEFVKGIDYSLTNLSTTQIVRGNYDEANKYINQLIQLATDEDRPKAMIKGMNRRAVVQYYQGNYQLAIQTNLEVVRLSETEGNLLNKINAYNNIGINFERLGENQKALEYYEIALELAAEEQHEYRQAAISANIGVIHKNEGRYNKARQYFLESIEFAERINNQSLLIDELSNLTEVYILENDWTNAQSTNGRALELATNLGDQNGILRAHSSTGKINYYNGNYNQAVAELKRALSLAVEIEDKEELLTIYKYLHLSYAALNRSALAYEYLTLYSTQKDSIFNIEKTNELNRIETLYQVAQKDKEIVTQELQLERARQERNLLIGGTVFIGLLGLTIYFFLRRIIRGNRKLAIQTQQIQQQKITNLERENKILALDAMVMGQEEERKRIAKDLHDSLGSLMATVKGHFSAIQNEMDKLSNLNIYKKTDELIDKACDEVRRISHNMMPKALTENGLIDALDDLVHDISQSSKLKINFSTSGFEKRLGENMEIMIFRIVQELLQNVLKHAQASNVLVQLIQQNNIVHLTVEDDGKGFDQSNQIKGLGLESVHSRVDYLNGEWHIDSVLSEGTTVVINFPVQENE